MRSDRDRDAHRGGPWRRRRWRFRNDRADDRGSATVEFAVALPGVVALLLIFLAGWSALAAKVRLADAAGLAARATARGGPEAGTGQGAVPAGVTISVQREGDLVRVTLRQQVGLGPLPSITLREEAVALVEPEGEEP